MMILGETFFHPKILKNLENFSKKRIDFDNVIRILCTGKNLKGFLKDSINSNGNKQQ